MKFKPYNWNVVIIGFWNKAILTPNFIIEKILKKTQGSIFTVEVPIDLFGPPRIKSDDFIIYVDSKQIIIETVDYTIDKLIIAMEYAKNALIELPVTPCLASGFNIRYIIDDIDPKILKKIIESNIDNLLSTLDYDIIDRSFNRTLKFKDGTIKIIISFLNSEKLEFQINFNKDSSNINQLKDWITISSEELNNEIEKLKKIFLEGSYE